MAYWLAVEVAFVSHSILKQIGEPLGKVKAVHSPSPPHWVAKPIAVLSKELKMAVIDNSALKQYLHEAQYNTCIRGTLSSVSLTQRNVNVIPRVCSLLLSIGFRRKFYLQPSGHSFLSTSRHENSPVCCLLNKYRGLELSLTCDN